MSKDFKPRHAGRAGGSGLLLGLFIGFLLGLALATGIAVYFFKTPMPFTNKNAPPAKVDGKDAKDNKGPTKGEDGKPRFDFYRILPGQEEPVSDKQLKDAAKQGTKSTAEPSKEAYFIQAGAFQNPADADNLKAKLAMLGLEANVEPTTVPEKGVMYRVRLGPYGKIDEINKIRTQLAQSGIEPALVRVRDPKEDAKGK